jgi:hypothetical protein
MRNATRYAIAISAATLSISAIAQTPADAKTTKAPPAMACKANADCKGDREFCDTTPQCGPNVPGNCTKKPEICTEQFDPVQGCDGKTYSNACKARAAGMSVKAKATK